ncbi:MAG: aminoacyl-tRNA hydrolase [Patescibacteria group bacterium]|nr:aminoacyl-tRNA hydrolase [Patescibacteria group bacterium]MDD4610887.1 aminoacyl-tRNA hydrolase [Patescibacteria group bacterium]
MKIIVGLGNPGDKYKSTRHNAGFMAVDALAEKLGLKWTLNKKFKAEIATDNSPLLGKERTGLPAQAGVRLILAKPQTFMNLSGESAQAILSYYKLLPKFSLPSLIRRGLGGGHKNTDLSQILTVIHDDLDIELRKFKTSIDSRSAGHNGVESIINHLKTKNFTRIRIGIKTEMREKIPGDKFVLQKFSKEELTTINKVITEIIDQIGI